MRCCGLEKSELTVNCCKGKLYNFRISKVTLPRISLFDETNRLVTYGGYNQD